MSSRKHSEKAFIESAFCSGCGALMPELKSLGDIVCKVCHLKKEANSLSSSSQTYTIVFSKHQKRKSHKEGGEEEGPAVERICAKCGHDRMTYAALQLRSADEGQTVFFTCLKCKFKESENS